MQSSGLMNTWATPSARGSPCTGAMAEVAHSATQTKSLMHASVITYAIKTNSFACARRFFFAAAPRLRGYRRRAADLRDSNHNGISRMLDGMCRQRLPLVFLTFVFLIVFAITATAATSRPAEGDNGTWTFAVSGDSRNCGDFVMPAIAARLKADKDAFYWHLGDFRWMSSEDEDMQAMATPGVPMSKGEYQQRAWDDFLSHQIAAFGDTP